MKIYILPVDKKFQPAAPHNAFPPHSKGYMMETDFYDWINKQDFLTDDPNKADWHYLPIFWDFWFLSHDFGKTGKEELDAEVKRVTIDSAKTFTITQYDGGVQYDYMIDFAAAKLGQHGIPIPILTLPHKVPEKLPEKRWLSSFVGKLYTHPVRSQMKEVLKPLSDVQIIESKKGEELFVNSILESYSTLCPRGSAMGSFRFYESMQLGVLPIMLSDFDVRPFPRYIDWGSCSIAVNSSKKLGYVLKRMRKDKALEMGEKAKKVWHSLFNQGWCKYVIQTLEETDTVLLDKLREEMALNKVVTTGIHDDFDRIIKEKGYHNGAEIGVWFGNHAEKLLDITDGRLYGVDPYGEVFQTSVKDKNQLEWNVMYKLAMGRLAKYGNRYTHIRDWSSFAKNEVPDELDYVYIDGDHSYDGVLADLNNWFGKVREGGLIGGDDYGHHSLPGVKKAVNEFFKGNVRFGRDGVWMVQK